MLSSKPRLILFKIPKTSTRYASFLERFCNKNNSAGNSMDDGPSVNVQLENAFKLYNLENEPNSKVCLTRNLALRLYTQMQTVRRMENSCANLYKEKLIRGFCHLYVGQEACCVGIKSAMRLQDTIITSYRSHGWTWLMGVPIYDIIAELCQKQSGCSRGKGGSMHTYAPNFFGGNGIVGAQVPLGAGIAFAHAYTCDKGINFACYGDGAANQGQIHETFNMACLWKLPIVFVCENNKYGMGTSVKRSACSTDYYTRGDYIPGIWVNGNDILAVRSAADYVINYASKCGPIVLELETYRYHGHSMSDPGTSYRKREEVQIMREKHDPIGMFKRLCLKEKLILEEELKKIDDSIKKEIDDDVKQIRKEKDTDPNELAKDVYALNLEGYIRNISKYDLKHSNVGVRLIPPGTIKATSKSSIKESPKEEQKSVAKNSTNANKRKEQESDPKYIRKEKPTPSIPTSSAPASKLNTRHKDTTKSKNAPNKK